MSIPSFISCSRENRIISVISSDLEQRVYITERFIVIYCMPVYPFPYIDFINFLALMLVQNSANWPNYCTLGIHQCYDAVESPGKWKGHQSMLVLVH